MLILCIGLHSCNQFLTCLWYKTHNYVPVTDAQLVWSLQNPETMAGPVAHPNLVHEHSATEKCVSKQFFVPHTCLLRYIAHILWQAECRNTLKSPNHTMPLIQAIHASVHVPMFHLCPLIARTRTYIQTDIFHPYANWRTSPATTMYTHALA